jgi:hypothetical protein
MVEVEKGFWSDDGGETNGTWKKEVRLGRYCVLAHVVGSNRE